MKKYKKLIGLVVLMISAYVVFFVSARNMNESYPKVSLEDRAGNRSHIDDLVIDGNVHVYSNGIDEDFRLDAGGVTFNAELSLIDRLDGNISNRPFNQLRKNYRSFMRGKDEYNSYYDETDDYLAFVTIPIKSWAYEPTEFDLSLLDKKSNKAERATVDIPNRKDYSYVEVVDVFVKQNDFFITTVNTKDELDGEGLGLTEELVRHQFDMDKQVFIETDILQTFEHKNTEDLDHFVRVFPDKANRENLYIVEMSVSYTDYGEDQTKITDLYSVGRTTKQLKQYDIDKGKQFTGGSTIELYDGKLYYLNEEDEAVQLISYDIQTKQEEKSRLVGMQETTFSLSEFIAEHMIYINDHKMYIVPNYVSDEAHHLYVYDVKSLEPIYTGELGLSGDAYKYTSYDLNIHDVYTQ